MALPARGRALPRGSSGRPVLTIHATAAARSSQAFMLAGTLVLLPLILGYVAFVYWVFRGKVREGESYH